MKLTADMKVVGPKKEKKRDEKKKKPLHSDEGDTALRTVKPCTERGQFNI